LKGNGPARPGHRAIRLGLGSAGTVLAVNIAGFQPNPAVLVEAGVGAWKIIALDPSLSVRQPQFEFADAADRRRVLRFACDPIDGSSPIQWSVEGPVVLRDLPTSPAGLPPGSLWRDRNDIKIV